MQRVFLSVGFVAVWRPMHFVALLQLEAAAALTIRICCRGPWAPSVDTLPDTRTLANWVIVCAHNSYNGRHAVSLAHEWTKHWILQPIESEKQNRISILLEIAQKIIFKFVSLFWFNSNINNYLLRIVHSNGRLHSCLGRGSALQYLSL